jgi:hypothetical protein
MHVVWQHPATSCMLLYHWAHISSRTHLRHHRCWPCLVRRLPVCLEPADHLVPSSPMGLGPRNPAAGRNHLVSARVRSTHTTVVARSFHAREEATAAACSGTASTPDPIANRLEPLPPPHAVTPDGPSAPFRYRFLPSHRRLLPPLTVPRSLFLFRRRSSGFCPLACSARTSSWTHPRPRLASRSPGAIGPHQSRTPCCDPPRPALDRAATPPEPSRSFPASLTNPCRHPASRAPR